jgi:hypothetical protein
MYITDLRLSALALFISVTTVLTAARFVPSQTEDCGACVMDVPTSIETVMPVTIIIDGEASSEVEWTMS